MESALLSCFFNISCHLCNDFLNDTTLLELNDKFSFKNQKIIRKLTER